MYFICSCLLYMMLTFTWRSRCLYATHLDSFYFLSPSLPLPLDLPLQFLHDDDDDDFSSCLWPMIIPTVDTWYLYTTHLKPFQVSIPSIPPSTFRVWVPLPLACYLPIFFYHLLSDSNQRQSKAETSYKTAQGMNRVETQTNVLSTFPSFLVHGVFVFLFLFFFFQHKLLENICVFTSHSTI